MDGHETRHRRRFDRSHRRIRDDPDRRLRPGKQPGGETPGTTPSACTATSDYTAPAFPCYSLIVRIGDGPVSEVAAGTTLETDTAGPRAGTTITSP